MADNPTDCGTVIAIPTKVVKFYTGLTTSPGGVPWDMLSKLLPSNIGAELEEVRIERVKGLRGYGKVWGLLILCEEDSPEAKWLRNNPLYEEVVNE